MIFVESYSSYRCSSDIAGDDKTLPFVEVKVNSSGKKLWAAVCGSYTGIVLVSCQAEREHDRVVRMQQSDGIPPNLGSISFFGAQFAK